MGRWKGGKSGRSEKVERWRGWKKGGVDGVLDFAVRFSVSSAEEP